jgi:hypothetical protein
MSTEIARRPRGRPRSGVGARTRSVKIQICLTPAEAELVAPALAEQQAREPPRARTARSLYLSYLLVAALANGDVREVAARALTQRRAQAQPEAAPDPERPYGEPVRPSAARPCRKTFVQQSTG